VQSDHAARVWRRRWMACASSSCGSKNLAERVAASSPTPRPPLRILFSTLYARLLYSERVAASFMHHPVYMYCIRDYLYKTNRVACKRLHHRMATETGRRRRRAAYAPAVGWWGWR
jgi:hypothetical protein